GSSRRDATRARKRRREKGSGRTHGQRARRPAARDPGTSHRRRGVPRVATRKRKPSTGGVEKTARELRTRTPCRGTLHREALQIAFRRKTWLTRASARTVRA